MNAQVADLRATIGRVARSIFALALGSSTCASARAADQHPPIEADRPGFANSASVLERGTAQIELGANFGREQQGGHVDTWVIPEPLLRVGVFERAELRLGAAGFVSAHANGEPTENAGSDLELSTKVRLFDQARWVPATSVLAGLSFPTGGSAVTSDGYDPFATLLASWAIGERFGFDANVEIGAPTQGPDDSDRSVETFVAASWDMTVTDRIGAFLEGYATLRGSGRSDDHAIDAGFTFLATDDIQLDVSAGMGLDRWAPDLFVEVGVAWRFWKKP